MFEAFTYDNINKPSTNVPTVSTGRGMIVGVGASVGNGVGVKVDVKVGSGVLLGRGVGLGVMVAVGSGVLLGGIRVKLAVGSGVLLKTGSTC